MYIYIVYLYFFTEVISDLSWEHSRHNNGKNNKVGVKHIKSIKVANRVYNIQPIKITIGW